MGPYARDSEDEGMDERCASHHGKSFAAVQVRTTSTLTLVTTLGSPRLYADRVHQRAYVTGPTTTCGWGFFQVFAEDDHDLRTPVDRLRA